MASRKRGNIIAAILIGIVVLAGGAIILSNTVMTSQKKTDSQQRLIGEADSTMRQAISLGINEWMKNGFSDKNKVWYSNYPLPADLDEAKESLDRIVNKKVAAYMSRLQMENEQYKIDPNVKVSFDIGSELSADDEAGMKAKVTEFKVGLENVEFSQMQDISTVYPFPYKAWLIYSRMHDWHEKNADDLTQGVKQAMMAKPCQLVAGGCDCAEISFSDSEKESLKLTKAEIISVLDTKIAALQSLFDGTGIKCSYEIKSMNIENTENTAWTIGDVGPNGTLKVQPRGNNYNYELMNWQETKTLPAPGDPNGGLPVVAGSGISGATERPSLGIEMGFVNTYNMTGSVNEECVGSLTRLGALVGGEANLAQSMKIGMLAMDKKVAALFTVRCEDPTTSIEAMNGLEPLAGEISMRFSLALDCPLPNHGRDIYVDQSLYDKPPAACQGGSCFLAGTMISMADGTKKPIEDVRVGDMILSYSADSGKYLPGMVVELEGPVRQGYYAIRFSDDSIVRATNEHPFYAKKTTGETGWASIVPSATHKDSPQISDIMPLRIGDYVLNENGRWVKVHSIEYVPGKVQTYNLKEVTAYDTFFADEKLVHNKCCFAAGTPVTMADGRMKPIEEIEVGDMVLTMNLETGRQEPAEVLELQKPIREGLYSVVFDNGRTLELTNDHPLYAKADGISGWAAIEPDAAMRGYALDSVRKLDIGNQVLMDTGDYATIVSIAYKPGEVQTYTLKKVSRNMNFFANGFLAHNQKLIGFIGLACPIDCPPCYGCQPKPGVSSPRQGVSDDWECQGPIQGLICGKCGLCGADGRCSIPQVAGYPCFEIENGRFTGDNEWQEGNCYACNGIGTGDEACVMNPPEITSLIQKTCGSAFPCSKCDGSGRSPAAGGCSAPLSQDAVCNNLAIPEMQRACMKCAIGQVGVCQADPRMEGELCGDCATCSGGLCNAPASGTIGNCKTDSKPCMKCSSTTAGACQVDTSLDSACDSCKECGTDGSCVAAPSKVGQSCGDCKVCDGLGNCVAGNEGASCKQPSDGCTWSCQSGQCKLSNPGASCTTSTNTCGLPQKCGNNGCESADPNWKCCGTAKCPSGSACCNQLNLCGQCPTPS